MNQIETLRKEIIKDLFSIRSMSNPWSTWKSDIEALIPESDIESSHLINLGNNLFNIFKHTGSLGNERSQGGLSASGAGWECLVCWYLNLCLAGSNTVVLKAKKKFIPKNITNAISVNYGDFKSNTESDLLAITFPSSFIPDDNYSFISLKDHMININNIFSSDKIPESDLTIIQCKTNWNDNAQIPMLWDLIYLSRGFKVSEVSVGDGTLSPESFNRFSYAFVTVPTSNVENFTENSTAVKRVSNISGGVFWAKPTISGVAENLFKLITKNFSATLDVNYETTWGDNIGNVLNNIIENDNYFKIHNS